MSKRHNLKTQKGILAHIADRGEGIRVNEEIAGAYVGQPATFHIGSDCYADEVTKVVTNADGIVTKVVTNFGGTFVLRLSANCSRLMTEETWVHEEYLRSLKGSGWVELGVAVTHHDPSF